MALDQTAEIQMETAQTKETIPFWLAVFHHRYVHPAPGPVLRPVQPAPLGGVHRVGGVLRLGGTPSNIKTIIPAYTGGVAWGVLMILLYTWIAPHMTGASVYPMYIALFIGVSAMVYVMKYFKVFQTGSLPYFNGLSMPRRSIFWRPPRLHHQRVRAGAPVGRLRARGWLPGMDHRLVERDHHLPAEGHLDARLMRVVAPSIIRRSCP